jgi:hypothetical protein
LLTLTEDQLIDPAIAPLQLLGSLMEYWFLNIWLFNLLPKGGDFIKYCFVIIVALSLVGCSFSNNDSPIFKELGVSQSGAVPDFTLLNREEMANKDMRYTEVEIEDIGEQAARLFVADSFSGLNDHFSSGLIDVVDQEGNKYRAIYIGNYNKENFSTENEYEKEVLELYQSREKENDEKMPYIEFEKVD